MNAPRAFFVTLIAGLVCCLAFLPMTVSPIGALLAFILVLGAALGAAHLGEAHERRRYARRVR